MLHSQQNYAFHSVNLSVVKCFRLEILESDFEREILKDF